MNWRPQMDRALALAALGAGTTSPNPMVGALVLDQDGQLVGEGYHCRAGEPHAEVMALAQAAGRARGGTLVVTLEPRRQDRIATGAVSYTHLTLPTIYSV